MVHGTERLSYQELARRVAALSAGLSRSGVKQGDRVGIYLEASVPQVVSIFGVSRSGGVFVPINASLFAEQVAHIAKDCGMTALITTKAKLATLSDVLTQIPSLRFIVVTEEGEMPATSTLPLHHYEEFCELPPLEGCEHSISKDLGAILCTRQDRPRKPKGVMLSSTPT